MKPGRWSPGGCYLGVNPPDAEVILDNKPIKRAPAYEIFLDRGAGGLAQLGGAPGVPGDGGMGVNASHYGCSGGWGGQGGSGGYGGGGLGGPSIGVAHLVGQPAALHDSAVKTGMPGKGGPGGNPAVDGSDGEDGTRYDTLGFPQ